MRPAKVSLLLGKKFFDGRAFGFPNSSTFYSGADPGIFDGGLPPHPLSPNVVSRYNSLAPYRVLEFYS